MSSFAVGRDHNKNTEKRRKERDKERMMKLRDNPLTLKRVKIPGSAPKTLKNRPNRKEQKKQAKAAIAKAKANKTRKISQKALDEYATQYQSWGRGELKEAIKDKKRHDKEQKRGKPFYTKIHHWVQKKTGSKAKKERDAHRAEELEKEMKDSQIYSANWKEYQEARRKGKKKTYKEKEEERIEKEKQDDEDASQRRIELKNSLPTLINKRSSIINIPAPPVPPVPPLPNEKEVWELKGGGRTRRRKRKRRRITKKKKRRRRRTKKKKNKKRRRTKKRRRK